jgi:hypothetical protein
LRLDLDMGIWEVRLPRSAVTRFPSSVAMCGLRDQH